MNKIKSALLLSSVTLLISCGLQPSKDNTFSNWQSFQNNHYAFITTIKPAIEGAREACANIGAKLVRIDSAEENEFIRSQAFNGNVPTELKGQKLKDGQQFWIGGNDQTNEGIFTWEDKGEQFWPQAGLYTNWGSTNKGSQPNNFFKNGEDEDCIVIRKNGSWYDIGCVSRFSFPICEKAQ